MANRRMFSSRIANSAKFLQMPSEAQLLYFHLIIRADDDGIVESYPVVKLLGLASDNFKILVAKGYIKELNEDQVIVIIDWLEHNTIRADRKVNSFYLPLLKSVLPELEYISPKPRKDVKDNSKRVGGQSTVGISKVKLSKDNIYICSFEEFWKQYPKKVAKKKAEQVYKKIATCKKKETEVMEGLEKYTNKWRVEKTDVKFIPNPVTWLNQERWEDDVIISNTQFNKNARKFEREWEENKSKSNYQEPLVEDGNGGVVKLSELLNNYK